MIRVPRRIKPDEDEEPRLPFTWIDDLTAWFDGLSPRQRFAVKTGQTAVFVIVAACFVIGGRTAMKEREERRALYRAAWSAQFDFGALRCAGGMAEYGIRLPHDFKGQVTVIALPDNVRQVQHYEPDCRPRLVPVQGDWSTGLYGRGRAPLITLRIEPGPRITGYAPGAAPPMSPGVPSPDNRQILIALRNSYDNGFIVTQRVIEDYAKSATRAGHLTGPSGRAHRYYTGNFNTERPSDGSVYRVNDYMAECGDHALCHVLAPIDDNGPENFRGLALEIWMDESHMPHARTVLLQAQQLLVSASSRRDMPKPHWLIEVPKR